MSASTGVSGSHGVRPARVVTRRRPVAVAIGLGLIGVGEVLAVFLAVESRLPPVVTDHFGVTGQPNGSLAPLSLLVFETGMVAAIAAVFALFLAAVARSVPLMTQLRGRHERPLLALEGVIVVGIFPLVAGLLFASAAGVLPVAGSGLGLVMLVIGLVSPVAILLVLLVGSQRHVRTLPALSASGAPYPAAFAVGGPIELSCSSCGQEFRLSGVPLFAPHLGVGQFGSLYLRCPRCGEQGWDQVRGRVARGA